MVVLEGGFSKPCSYQFVERNEEALSLTEVVDFHHAASKALVFLVAEGSEGPPASQAGTLVYLTSPELHTELVR